MDSTDIIREAGRIMASDNHDVILHLKGDEAFGGVAVRFGTLTGYASLGDDATITVYDYHDSAGFGSYPSYRRNTNELVPVGEIIRIKQNWHQV